MRYSTLYAILALFIISARAAVAGDLPLIVVRHSLEGIKFTTPIRIETSQINGERIELKAWAELSHLTPVLNTLADRSAGRDITHTGTALWSENGMLKIKVHLKYRVGGFIGSTNGSVVVLLRSVVKNDTISLVTHAVQLNISNDLVRAGSALTGFGDDVKARIVDGLQKALSAEDAALALPSSVRELGIKLTDAHFRNRDKGLFLLISGSLPKEIRLERKS